MNFVIRTEKKKEELLYILKNNVQERQNTWIQKITTENQKYFNGSVEDDGSFKISRTIRYNNSFLPIIDGNIVDDGNSSVINISMHYHPFVLAFMAFWFIGVLIGCIVMPFQKLDRELFVFRFVPYFMLGAGVLLVFLPYKIETNIAKNKLIELLK